MINKKYQLKIIIFIILLFTSTLVPPNLVYAEDANDGYGPGGNGPNNNTSEGGDSNQQQNDQSNQNQTKNQENNQQPGPNQNGSDGRNQTGDGNQNKQWRYQYRNQKGTMNMTCESNRTRIRLQYRQNNTEETFEFMFNIDNIPTLTLSFIPNLNTTVNRPHFHLYIEKIIEYYDTNNNGRYDRNDLIASSLSFSNMTFTDIHYTNTTSSDGDIIYIMETHTIDNIFALTIYIVTNETSLYNNIITPEEMKIDFIITNYSFSNQTTQLALVTQLETHYQHNFEEQSYDENRYTATNERQMNVSSQNHTGFFSWSNQVNVDSKNQPVNVTILSETGLTNQYYDKEPASKTEIIFSYPQGLNIIHDPKIGVNLLGSIFPSIITDGELTMAELFNLITIYIIFCGIAAILFIGVIYIRKRR